MMEKMFLLLLGIFLFCGCGSSRKASKEYLAQKRHYYLVQGYRPVVLPGTKTVAEESIPLVCIREGETFRQCGVRLPDVFGEISRP